MTSTVENTLELTQSGGWLGADHSVHSLAHSKRKIGSMKYSIDGTLVEIEPDESGQPSLRVIDQRTIKMTPEIVQAAIKAHQVGAIHTRIQTPAGNYTISRMQE
jgi:hypothetical protein